MCVSALIVSQLSEARLCYINKCSVQIVVCIVFGISPEMNFGFKYFCIKDVFRQTVNGIDLKSIALETL